MKKRNGLVSNSSSSSFIIALKNSSADVCECCGRGGENPLDMVEALLSGCESEIDRSGSEEVVKYIKDNWFDDDDEYAELIKSIKEKTSEGFEIASVSIDYNDEAACSYIETNKDIVILNRWD
jgi:hypothetical protein